MKVNITQASKMVGHTRATMYAHIQKKGITTTKDENDNPLIDISELIRVYGDKVKPLEGQKETDMEKPPETIQPIHDHTPQNGQIIHDYTPENGQPSLAKTPHNHLSQAEVLKERIRHLEELHENERRERSREREQLNSEIDALRLNLEKAQNHHNQLTALITDQRSEQERRGDDISKQGQQVGKPTSKGILLRC